jgi:hypothetical protein
LLQSTVLTGLNYGLLIKVALAGIDLYFFDAIVERDAISLCENALRLNDLFKVMRKRELLI